MSLENVLEHFKLKTFFLVKNIYSEIDVKKCQILKVKQRGNGTVLEARALQLHTHRCWCEL